MESQECLNESTWANDLDNELDNDNTELGPVRFVGKYLNNLDNDLLEEALITSMIDNQVPFFGTGNKFIVSEYHKKHPVIFALLISVFGYPYGKTDLEAVCNDSNLFKQVSARLNDTVIKYGLNWIVPDIKTAFSSFSKSISAANVVTLFTTDSLLQANKDLVNLRLTNEYSFFLSLYLNGGNQFTSLIMLKRDMRGRCPYRGCEQQEIGSDNNVVECCFDHPEPKTNQSSTPKKTQPQQQQKQQRQNQQQRNQQQQPQPQQQRKQSQQQQPNQTQCKYGSKCTKIQCTFLHPRTCKFGLSCKNKDTTCQYRHL